MWTRLFERSATRSARRLRFLFSVFSALLLVVIGQGCTVGGSASAGSRSADPSEVELATFAGGCFWCSESDFEHVDGVIEVTSGYTGGEIVNPTYEQVSSGRTRHAEAVRIEYDPTQIGYEALLRIFWHSIDPTADYGQFCDHGPQYRSEIFYHGEAQREAAEASRDAVIRDKPFDGPIHTRITEASTFYPAEEYHQDYYKKNPDRYKRYRVGCGRDRRLEELWGASKSDGSSLRDRLTPEQYFVTQEDGTEPPFRNAYWDNRQDGIYVDVVDGEPLFSSTHKFDSGTGWPSFTEPLIDEKIVELTDYELGVPRTEIRSQGADSHLGHVFNDGPAPTGLRYCINSAALRFIPAEELEQEGYEEYRALFEGRAARAEHD